MACARAGPGVFVGRCASQENGEAGLLVARWRNANLTGKKMPADGLALGTWGLGAEGCTD